MYFMRSQVNVTVTLGCGSVGMIQQSEALPTWALLTKSTWGFLTHKEVHSWFTCIDYLFAFELKVKELIEELLVKEAHFNEHASVWNSRELNEWIKHALIFNVKYALEQMHDLWNLSGLNAWTKLELILNAKHVFVDL